MLQFGIYVHKVLPCFKREKNAHYKITKQFFTALKWLIPLPSLLFLRVLTTLNAFEMREREHSTAQSMKFTSKQNWINIFRIRVMLLSVCSRAKKSPSSNLCGWKTQQQPISAHVDCYGCCWDYSENTLLLLIYDLLFY